MMDLTLVIPYYRNPQMLERQLQEIGKYPQGLCAIIVDDGSREPALPIVYDYARKGMNARALPTVGVTYTRVLRIGVDIPWNREGARNLGARVCHTEWLLNVDIDHVLPAEAVPALLAFEPDSKKAYRFPRYRVGQADATRKKDWAKNGLPDSAPFGKVHPHVDSHLMTRARYWKVGGYNEDFSGVLGGGNEFLKRLERHVTAIEVLPEPICLHVHTRHAVPDASDLHCSRNPMPGHRKGANAAGLRPPTSWLRFPWERVL